jgi:hypothetical protein
MNLLMVLNFKEELICLVVVEKVVRDVAVVRAARVPRVEKVNKN